MNSLSPKLGLTLAIALFAMITSVSAHAERSLILKTLPDDTVIELTGNLSILPDGNIEAQPVDPDICPADSGSCEDVEVGNFAFRANNQTSITVDEGDPIAFSWKSRGAWSCQAGGNLPGWNAQNLVPDSADAGTSRIVSSAGLADDSPYLATLICSNGPVSSNNGVPYTVSINVEEGFIAEPVPAICNTVSRLAPAGWRRLSTGSLSCRYDYGWVTSADCREFDKIWPGPFMNVGGLDRILAQRDSKDYIAIRFTTEGLSPTETGQLNFNNAAGSMGVQNTEKLVSISQCPGDFNQAAIAAETGCFFQTNTQNLPWGGISSGRLCKLEANKTYYLNIIHTASPPGTATQSIEPHPTCASGTRCGTLVKP